MIWRPTTVRGRLVVWYTGFLTAMVALLGATAMLLLEHGLKRNVDDSLNSAARVISQSIVRPAFLGRDIEDALQSMLGPELAERFFQLLDPYGRLDPRLRAPRRSGLPLSAEALSNAERWEATFETIGMGRAPAKSFRLLTLRRFVPPAKLFGRSGPAQFNDRGSALAGAHGKQRIER